MQPSPRPRSWGIQLANMDEDLQNQEEPEELEDASLGFDPAHAESICFRCGGTVVQERKAGGNSGNDKIARETKIVGVFYHLSLLMAKERVMAKVEILSLCQNIIINA